MDLENHGNYPVAYRPRSFGPITRALTTTANTVVPFVAHAVENYRKRAKVEDEGVVTNTPPSVNSNTQMAYRRRRMSRRRPRRSFRRRRYSGSRMSINTFQRDASRQYTRRGAPGRVRRRVRRFIARVNNVISAAQPLQIYTYEFVTNGSTAANDQGYYGVNVGDITQLKDMFVQAYNETLTTNVAYNRRLVVKNMCIDYQFTNTGSYPIILDVYHVMCRAGTPTAYTMVTLWEAGVSALSTPAGAATGTAIDKADPSLTVFENPFFCKFFRVKSKKEVLLASGNTVTFQLRKSRNREFEMQKVNSENTGYPGYTEGLFFMWRGTPRNTGGAGAAELTATSVTVSYQVTGHYGIPPTTLLREAGLRET